MSEISPMKLSPILRKTLMRKPCYEMPYVSAVVPDPQRFHLD
jgi:hypothetical protein